MAKDIYDNVDEITKNAAVDQIMLRALLREFVKRYAEGSSDRQKSIREIGESLQDFVSGFRVPDVDELMMEQAKEGARMNFDQVIRSLDGSD